MFCEFKGMYSIGKGAKVLGVCIKTLRRWDASGKVSCVRTAGGHRRFSHCELLKLLTPHTRRKTGLPDVKSGFKKRCAIYGRVSTHKQKKRGDLTAQLKVLEKYAYEKNFELVKGYHDLGSGLNTNRKGLWRLIQDAKKGVFSHLVINYKDRLTRFGFTYLEQYLKEFGVEIITLNALGDKHPESELVEDLVAIIQSFTGKLYGLRSHKNKRILA